MIDQLKKNKKSLLLVLIVAGVTTALAYHEVDKILSEEDRSYIDLYVEDEALPKNSSYEEELKFIVSVQDSVLRVAPRNGGIPLGQGRGPRELYEAGKGLCYDRSRVIEKILLRYGFVTRHVSLYSRNQAGQIWTLITPGGASHAVTEVLTKRGWLVLDSNARWVSIDSTNRPVSIKQIQSAIENRVTMQWAWKPPAKIYTEPFTFVYGLYSRHGQFYPPYNFIPDINYHEFLQNFVS